MKKKRIDNENTVRNDTPLSMIVDSSSDETDKLITNGSITIKIDNLDTKESVKPGDQGAAVTLIDGSLQRIVEASLGRVDNQTVPTETHACTLAPATGSS